MLLGAGHGSPWKYVAMNVLGVLWYMVCMFVNPLSVYFYQGAAQNTEAGVNAPENSATDKSKESGAEKIAATGNVEKSENEGKETKMSRDSVEAVSSSVVHENKAAEVDKTEVKATNEQSSPKEETSNDVSGASPPLACPEEEDLDSQSESTKDDNETAEEKSEAEEKPVESKEDVPEVVEKQSKELVKDNQDTPLDTESKSEESSKVVEKTVQEESASAQKENVDDLANETVSDQAEQEVHEEEKAKESEIPDKEPPVEPTPTEKAEESIEFPTRETVEEEQCAVEAGEDDKAVDNVEATQKEEIKQSEEVSMEENAASEQAGNGQEQQSEIVDDNMEEKASSSESVEQKQGDIIDSNPQVSHGCP